MRRSLQFLLVVILGALLIHITVFYMRAKPLDAVPAGSGATPSVLKITANAEANTSAHSHHVSLEPLDIGDPHRHHPYEFTLNHHDACQGGKELVMVCITAVKNFKERETIRETWGAYAYEPSHNTSLVFLLGRTNSTSLQKELEKESRHYKDIVQEDFLDSYRNLSLKSVALLKWVTVYCSNSRFVLKVDDDMYINVPNAVAALRQEYLNQPDFILGHIFQGVQPVQDKKSKWYTPQENFNEKVYPVYTSGTAYSMTTSAAMKLYRAAASVPVFWLEDVYVTGLLARKADVKRIHNGKFNYINRGVDGCYFRTAISGHRYTAEDIRNVHEQLNDKNLVCKDSHR